MPVAPGGVNAVVHDPDASVQVPGLTDPLVVDQDTVPVGVVRPLAGFDVSATVAVHVEVPLTPTGFGEQTTVVLVEWRPGGGGAAGASGPAAKAADCPVRDKTAPINAAAVNEPLSRASDDDIAPPSLLGTTSPSQPDDWA